MTEIVISAKLFHYNLSHLHFQFVLKVLQFYQTNA